MVHARSVRSHPHLPLLALALLAACGRAPVTPAPAPTPDLESATAVRRLDPATALQLDAYVQFARLFEGVPGVGLAVVKNGQVVYARGYGDRGDGRPVEAGTQFAVGSVSKPITTSMMAAIADTGPAGWNTPASAALPGFRLADPALSAQLTLRDLVCNCLGVPRRDLEIAYTTRPVTPQRLLEQVSTYPVSGVFRKTFAYSNQLVALGGYGSAGALDADPAQTYARQLQTRLLDPLGMGQTTLAFGALTGRGNYAQPYGLAASGERRRLPLDAERWISGVAPAGGVWSSAPDLGRFLIMQLRGGLDPEGRRVVSEASLALTHTPQVTIAENLDYGLGWFTQTYRGRRLIQHGGNTLGFTSFIGFMPDQGLAVAVVSNGEYARLPAAVGLRALGLLLREPPTDVTDFVQGVLQDKQNYRDLSASLTAIDPAAVAPFTGTFSSAELGQIQLNVDNGRLYVRSGPLVSELKLATDPQSGQFFYVQVDPPLAGLPLVFIQNAQTGGQPVIALPGGDTVYVFVKGELGAQRRLGSQALQNLPAPAFKLPSLEPLRLKLPK